MSKENVASVETAGKDVIVTDYSSNHGKAIRSNVYRFMLKKGKVGILRLAAGEEYKVLQLIK